MLRTRRQRGGALEPTRLVPPFKYTNNPERQEIIRILYPYSTYFFALIKEIPWASFTSEHEGFQARTGEHPYIVIGGAAYEAYDTIYPTMIPRVHDVLDPTSDIDVLISPLIITNTTTDMYPAATETEKQDHIYPLKYETTVEVAEEEPVRSFLGGIRAMTQDSEPIVKKTLVLTPIMEDYTKWIQEQFAVAIGKIAYNFAEWFGKIPHPTEEFLPLVQEDEPHAVHVEVIPFHPIYVIRMLTEAGVKVQVRFYNGSKLVNFMECLFWEDAVINRPITNPFPAESHFIPDDLQKSPDGVIINSFLYELLLQHESVMSRVGFSKPTNPYQYKFLNHIGRTMYLTGQFERILTEDDGSLDDRDRQFIRIYTSRILVICDTFVSLQKYAQKIIDHLGPKMLELLKTDTKIEKLLQSYIGVRKGGFRRTRRQRKRVRKTRKQRRG